MDRLTDRELEVFELIGQGRTTREIGYRLSRWPNDSRYLSRPDQRETAARKCGPASLRSNTLGHAARRGRQLGRTALCSDFRYITILPLVVGVAVFCACLFIVRNTNSSITCKSPKLIAAVLLSLKS